MSTTTITGRPAAPSIIRAVGQGIAIASRWIGRAVAAGYRAIGEAKRTLILINLLAFVTFRQLMNWAPDFTGYGAALLAGTVLVTVFYLLIRYAHGKHNFMAEIKKGNLAVALYCALYMAGLCIGWLSFAP